MLAINNSMHFSQDEVGRQTGVEGRGLLGDGRQTDKTHGAFKVQTHRQDIPCCLTDGYNWHLDTLETCRRQAHKT